MKDLYFYLLPWLEDTDVTTWPFVFSTIATAVITYTLVFFTVCITSFFSERFRALADVDKYLWCTKLTKLFYFPIPIFTGLWYLLVDDTLKDDIVNGTTKTAFVAIYMHVGYNLLDNVLMAVGKLLYGNRFSTALFIHHFVVLNLFSICTYYSGKGQYFCMLAFIEEIVGPLSYVNWMLAKAKLTHRSIMKVNQQVTVYLWHFRTLLDLYFVYTIIKNWSHIWNGIPVPLMTIIFLACSLMAFALTPRWTKMEAKRLYRQYSRKISFYNKMKPKETENKTQ
jgi:hypothetical protein